MVMRNFYKVSCLSLVLVGSALAQAQGQAGAQTGTSAQSQTSVSAGKSGAAASNNSNASAAAGTEQASGSLTGGSEINAKLSRPVDASKNKPGDEVTATTTEDIKSAGKVVIPRGSKLIGHVTEAQPRGSKGSSNNSGGAGGAASAAGSATGSAAGSATGSGANAAGSAAGNAASKLGVVFDRAVLKDGREVPINATIQAVAAAGSNLSSSGMGGVDTGISGAGSAAGSGRAAGGGLVGGVTGTAGGAVGTVGRTAGGVGGTLNSTVGGTAGAAANVTRSPGAVGGLDATGQLASGSKGAFGLKGLEIASSMAGSAQGQGSLITSTTRNVHLDSGTNLLLVTGAQATGNAK